MEHWQLKQRQSLPLDAKVRLTEMRIKTWYSHWRGNVYVAFSGGKDSTVLLDIVRNLFPHVPAVFADTGLEYPEIREFVKGIDNVTWLKPKMRFDKVIEKYGYPVIGKETAQKIHEVRTTDSVYLKHKRLYGDNKGGGKLPERWRRLLSSPFKISSYCCDVMKKRPFSLYESKTGACSIVGTMANESRLRQSNYLRHGCNAFDLKRPISAPIAFWLEEDIWEYIKTRDVPYSSIYNMGEKRTGCMFCMFGMQYESQPNKFQRMAKTHPKQYDYCINKLGCGKVLDFIGIPYKPCKDQPTLF